MAEQHSKRLPAAERRDALVVAASAHFADSSYRGSTVADLARSAGVAVAIVYRHFPSKAHLFEACLEREWDMLLARWERALADCEDPRDYTMAIAGAFLAPPDELSGRITSLWFQAIAEAPHEPVLKAAFERSLARAQSYVAGVFGAAREAGAYRADLQPSVEGWIFLAIGTLIAADVRTGMQMAVDLPRIHEERLRWLTDSG